MATLFVYYSYTGNTKKLAEDLAAKASGAILEIKDVQRPGVLKAYTLGCYAAIKGKAWPIALPDADLDAHDSYVLLAPVWAGNPPPAVFAFLERIPEGKAVTVKMISASGKSGCKDRLAGILQARGCSLEDFEDVKIR